MAFVETTAVHKLVKLHNRIRGVAGGASASKTLSILQILIEKAQLDIEPTMTSITSESMPHLKKGAMRDFRNILEQTGYWDDDCWNATDFIYTFPLRDPKTNYKISDRGSRLEFFSLDMPHKVRGPRRQRLFINEANNIPKETYDQLEIRTEDEIWLDWNPTNEFWFYTDVKGGEDVDFIILTYKDNEGLSPKIVKSLESRKENKSWWQVYGLGQLGEVEGKIYKGWKQVDDVPHEARLVRRGLDFGYSLDPAAMIDIYFYNGGYILDEGFVRTEMKNRQIADWVLNQPDPNVLTCADSAEPKSIAELQEYGVNIIGVAKGQGSVNHGIQFVQSQPISYTKRSLALKKSYNNYMWKTDKEGNILPVPDHYMSDPMDAVRYGFESLRPSDEDDYFEDDTPFDQEGFFA